MPMIVEEEQELPMDRELSAVQAAEEAWLVVVAEVPPTDLMVPLHSVVVEGQEVPPKDPMVPLYSAQVQLPTEELGQVQMDPFPAVVVAAVGLHKDSFVVGEEVHQRD
jgi:hypothetical protein